MLLRSSSLPLLGSFLSSISDSPITVDHSSSRSHPTPHYLKKISFLNHSRPPNFHSFSCNSSAMSHSLTGIPESVQEHGDVVPSGFRRVQSDGKLEGLTTNVTGEFHNSNPQRYLRQPNSPLVSIPSFSVYNSRDVVEEVKEGVGGEDGLERSITIGESIGSPGGDFSFSDGKTISFAEGIEEIEENDEGMERLPLFLARGLAIDVGGSATTDGAASAFPIEDLSGGGDESDIDNYYRRMIEEDPCNPLYLRNYAQFLFQSKGDLERAEDYYSRAILAEPGDGGILSEYAQLIWERHHDHQRALSYFEQAIQAASDNSHVLAAYASFLWQTEGSEEEEEEEGSQFVGVPLSHGAIASASAA
ncbi:uncharacterized protein LOC131245772 [Magnolia sinica]|uniref:uncharacterized protein LOC131245772 n=1 Tax=Magnolia sinica TaxID=86752 RepID=UPI0026583AE4|nr:uncharacterized protein LOC131245772 [Magnolia sinica]